MTNSKRSIKRRTAQLFFTGFAMGSADIVPGVSGGTMAFILGVYEELIFAIKRLSGETLKLFLRFKIKEGMKTIPFGFLIPLGVGLLTALAILAPVISRLLVDQPVLLWSFFFGLVAASIYIIRKRVVTWDTRDYVALGLATVFAFWLVGSVPVETPATPIGFFFAGGIAIIAMILPGVSGSFLLILMGKYSQILELVVDKNVSMLAIVALGAVVGLAVFSRVLSWLFTKHHDVVVATLTGFMLGSLRKIWPWKEVVTVRINSRGVEVPLTLRNVTPEISMEVFIAMGLAILAVALMLFLDSKQVTDTHTADVEDKVFAKKHKKALKSQGV